MSLERRFSYDDPQHESVGSAGMLPAFRGILPRIWMERSTGGAPRLRILRNASGNMPDGASRMLALPDQQRCAPFRLRLLMILLCAFFSLTAFGQSESEFAKANQEYAQGHFKEAIAGYEALVRAGQWNANLFYDLGNAYFRTRDFGRAILNYERALALDQHHPEATANLQIARDESRALELRPTRLERYLQFANVNQYSIAAAVALWLGIFGIVALIFARRRSAALISLSILCLLVCALAVWAIHTLDYGSKGHALAIVTGNDVQARLATADTANSVLALPPGSEIKILSTRGDWMYAALPNDLRGWIQTKNAEQVRL
jgi:tetratricopeptide (TPR) repeat protein